MLLTPAQKGFSMVTQYMLENNANPNIANEVQLSPLYIVQACMHAIMCLYRAENMPLKVYGHYVSTKLTAVH